jgi:hypothetical protein
MLLKGSDDDEQVDGDIEQRILAINFDEKLYRELEELQVCIILCKHCIALILMCLV